MTDGLGSKTYQYDQLSRLTSETRIITSVGNYPLSYGYNLAGELTSLTDPFGAQVGYSHDSAGRVASVTGTNFASISTYASNLQYRASGALKHLDYGNSKTLDAGYNARLQPTSFSVPGVMSKTYDYEADGRLKFSHDLVDAKFDRSYAYDHAGRITTALSGAEARNQGTTNLRPYQQSFVYDALGHLVERPVNHVWSGEGGGFSPTHQTYQNERNTVWTYDADGNLTDSGNVQYTVDAAGQAFKTISLTTMPYNGNPYSTITSITADQTLSFDGDGQVIKKVVAETTHDSTYGDQTTTATTTLIRSTVLGGKVVTEVSNGAKQRGYVYLGSEVMAWQIKSGTTELVKWEHRDLQNATFRLTFSNGAIDNTEKAELDPLNANAGTADPTTVPSLKKLSLYPGFGEAAMAGDTQCNFEGMLTPCSTVFTAISNGAAGQCPDNNCGPRFQPNRDGPGRGGWVQPQLGPNGFFNQAIGPSARPRLPQPTLKSFNKRPGVGQGYRNPDNIGNEDDGDADPQNSAQTPGPEVDKGYGWLGACNRSANDLMRTVRRDFSKFANYGELTAEGNAVGFIKFTPGPITQGRVIPITVGAVSTAAPSDLYYTRNVSVTVSSTSTTGFTFTTNPGHFFYPGTISFSARDVTSNGASAVEFQITAQGQLADAQASQASRSGELTLKIVRGETFLQECANPVETNKHGEGLKYDGNITPQISILPFCR